MKLWKVENRETRIRIDQGIFNHEGRKMTRRSGGKDEIGENRKSGNSESAFGFNPDRIGEVFPRRPVGSSCDHLCSRRGGILGPPRYSAPSVVRLVWIVPRQGRKR